MLDVPISQQNNNATYTKADCSIDVLNLNKVINLIESKRKVYEENRIKCSAEIIKVRSRLVCASCDPEIYTSIVGYTKKL